MQGGYPFEYPKALELPKCSTLPVYFNAAGIEITGMLMVPADDPAFLSEFRKYLCSFNYHPGFCNRFSKVIFPSILPVFPGTVHGQRATPPTVALF